MSRLSLGELILLNMDKYDYTEDEIKSNFNLSEATYNRVSEDEKELIKQKDAEICKRRLGKECNNKTVKNISVASIIDECQKTGKEINVENVLSKCQFNEANSFIFSLYVAYKNATIPNDNNQPVRETVATISKYKSKKSSIAAMTTECQEMGYDPNNAYLLDEYALNETDSYIANMYMGRQKRQMR